MKNTVFSLQQKLVTHIRRHGAFRQFVEGQNLEAVFEPKSESQAITVMVTVTEYLF